MDIQERYYKRNYVFGVLSGVLVSFGVAFIEPFTVLPVFITQLGGSSVVVGLVAAVYSAGWFLPQVFVSRYVMGRRLTLGIYSTMSAVRTLGFAGAAILTLVVSLEHSSWIMFGVISCLTLSTVCAGVAGVPFLEVTSKVIPVTSRGMFFGYRRFLGGIMGVVAGLVVSVILGNSDSAAEVSNWFYAITTRAAQAWGLVGRSFPRNYGMLFVIGGSVISLGMLSFTFVKEPEKRTVEPLRPLREHLSLGMGLLRLHSNFRLFLFVRICWQLTAMSFPFYATYAYQVLGFSESAVGIFVAIWVGAGVVSNYGWGRLADRSGNRIVLVATAAMSLISPVLMLVLLSVEDVPARVSFMAVSVTFFINGFARSGRFISNMTYLLEYAPEDRRPLFVGFINSMSFPFMLSPILGGLVVESVSYRALFIVSAVFAIVCAYLSSRLVEPRSSSSVDPSFKAT